MALVTISKQPSESFVIPVEYYGKLPQGTTLASATASAVINGTSTSAPVVGAVVVSGTQVLVRVTGGSDGVTYKITVLATLSDGFPLEDDFLLAVANT